MARTLSIDRGVADPRTQAPVARPALFTPAFLTVALAELAYFTADGVLLPALPRFVEGPLGGGNVAVGVVIGAFSISAFFLRPWAGATSDRRGRRLMMVAGASLFAVSVAGYLVATSVSVLVGMRLLTGVGERERRPRAARAAGRGVQLRLALDLPGDRRRAVPRRGRDRPPGVPGGMAGRGRAGRRGRRARAAAPPDAATSRR